jgi:DeoR/GlpR family transcriptional regulator of sugar metabolism
MYMTCEWHANHPAPDPQQAATKIKSLFDGHQAVSIITLAKAFGISVGTMHNVLEAAAHQGLVQAVHGQGWIPNSNKK